MIGWHRISESVAMDMDINIYWIKVAELGCLLRYRRRERDKIMEIIFGACLFVIAVVLLPLGLAVLDKTLNGMGKVLNRLGL